LLPWPTAGSRRVVLMPLEATPPGRNLEDSIAQVQSTAPAGSSFAPTRPDPDELLAASSTDWPLYAFQRGPHGLPPRSASAYLTLNILIGLVAALLVAVVFREQHLNLRRVSILALIALFLVLLTDVSHGLWMEWPIRYIVVLSTDHAVGALLAAGTAGGVLGLWKVHGKTRDPRDNAPGRQTC
jgi:hypothetical protein